MYIEYCVFLMDFHDLSALNLVLYKWVVLATAWGAYFINGNMECVILATALGACFRCAGNPTGHPLQMEICNVSYTKASRLPPKNYCGQLLYRVYILIKCINFDLQVNKDTYIVIALFHRMLPLFSKHSRIHRPGACSQPNCSTSFQP